MQRHVPREENPRVLADPGDEGIHHRLTLWLGVDGGVVGFWVEAAHHLKRSATVDEVIDDQNAFAVIAHQLSIRGFQDDRFSLGLVVVGFHADRIDDADVQFPRNDAGRDHAAAGDGDDGFPSAIRFRAPFVQPPRQRPAVAVHLVP